MRSSGRLAGVLAGLSVVCIAASLLAAPRPLGSQYLLQVEWEWAPRDQLSSVQEGGWGQRGDERNMGMGDVQGSKIQLLWGGNGKATTGTNVDGRPTVPGLHTDCIPGVLRSDCSPAQEDGAWSTDAESYLNSKTGGGHLKSMQKIQDDIDAGYAARDKFLDDCLRDATLCSGRGTGGDTPRWGTRTHPWAPEQGRDFGQYDNDGHWSHIPLPSGTMCVADSDGGLVSSAYYS